ncbi:MAG: His/Gly/Thr/Pro-type tRNA ligase C-terminal domain-containing protein [Candidatus Uhrbacteria bacterium]|nr:His/Gly/Thr/Pro-type tRNA ligase C-terminal domain-containing protein [Candidatus Uhrbacteria bacterium]
MKYSSCFAKTSKTAPADADSANAKFLIQAGFVDQTMAGVYTWLPFGLAVLRKVEQIVREEMNALGALEIFMPSLHPKEFWEATNRWDNVDILFKIHSQTDKDYALGASHEEVVTPLAKKFIESYKNLPFATYQINTKFRDELRAKSGVLRGREFRMKDMYSFHTSQEDLSTFYQKTLEAYVRAYSRCGLNVKVVEASGGIFTKNPSHEFQALTDAGEDTILACSTCEFGQNIEVATVKEGDACPKCGGVISTVKGIEVGNIFDLGTKYSDAFDLNFTDESGERKKVLMGCYGIGTSRLVGAIVEACHDDRGMIWPKSVAPFQVHLVTLNSKDDVVKEQIEGTASDLVRDLEAQGVEVLWDDREDVSPGAKFADADLIGAPLRVIISEKSLKEESVEWKERSSSESRLIKVTDVIADVIEFVK